jgi:ABC-2 type transport system permease protein
MLGRFITVFTPVFFALILGVVFGLFHGGDLPWRMIGLYSVLLFAMSFVFLGIAFWLSTIVKSSDIALGGAFVIWIVLLAFIDIALMGLMLQNRLDDNIIVTLAMLNPIEVFRIGAITLFDPELTVIGPVAYYLLDTLGSVWLMVYAVMYPIVLGALFAYFGYSAFKKKDLL